MTELPPDYTLDWYRQHTRGPVYDASLAVGRALYDILRPHSVVDVGCGPGAILHGLLLRASETRHLLAAGFEHPEAVRRIVDNYLWLPGHYVPLWPWDFEVEDGIARVPRCDLVICTEVGEHLSPGAGDLLVYELTRSAKWVAWSAAIPGQGGENHINERPLEYWAERFARRGYHLDAEATDAVQDQLRQKLQGAEWYSRILVYGRSP